MPAINPLPTPPSRNDPANFSDRADAFLAALPAYTSEANALLDDVHTSRDTVQTLRNEVIAAGLESAAANAATAATKADEAASSASEAFGYLQAYRATSYGALAADPVVDPNGNPPTVGDEYFNTSMNLLKRFNGVTWQASDIATANLAATGGAALVGADDGASGSLWTTVAGFIAFLLSSLGSSVIGFVQAGVGAIGRSVQSKLREFVSVNDYSSLQAALNTGKSVLIPSGVTLYESSVNFTADGQSIFGLGNDSVLKSAAGSVYINTNGFDNLSIRDLTLDGTAGADGGIRVISDSQNVKFLNVYFHGGNQRVWLWECDNVTVSGCTFDSTGYGIIGQAGYSSNHVLIDGNTAVNMWADFVEANQTSTGASEFWTITNNVFTGSAGYPTAATEKRFVGITSVRGVIISGNTVKNVAGDSAIHLEDTLGETIISSNVFDNVVCYGGNSGYIYLLNSAENTVIDGNIFLRTNTGLPTACALDVSSAVYSHSIQFTNNRVAGVSPTGNFYAICLFASVGEKIISGNQFENLTHAINHVSSGNVSFTGNRVRNCQNGLVLEQTPAGGGGNDWKISDNVFSGTTGASDIYSGPNTNGTNAPNRWVVDGNVFSKQVAIGGQWGATAGTNGDAQDITISNNVFRDGATLYAFGTMSRIVRFNNVFNNIALGGGTTLIQDVPAYASDAAAATGGIPIGGLYRNGSVLQVRVA